MTHANPVDLGITPEMIEAGVDVYLGYDSEDLAVSDPYSMIEGVLAAALAVGSISRPVID